MSHDERSHSVRVLPGLLHRRWGSDPRHTGSRSPVLYRLSYVCIDGALVFPSRQIFSVPRFCQQITGAITTSRLEGLTSGLRITQTAIPLKRSSLAVSTLNWHRRLDLNQRMRESKSLALPLGYACMVFPCRNPTGDTGRVCSRVTGTAPAYRVELALLRKEV